MVGGWRYVAWGGAMSSQAPEVALLPPSSLGS
uniref:Uncharacterized protein n=1 Tax=Arundo donax TaxID=35708 RepID=A0A0A9AKR2_ARUDO